MYKSTSSPRISQVGGYAEVGLDFTFDCMPCVLLQPFAGIAGNYFHCKRIAENNDNVLSLYIDSKSKTNCLTRLGIHLTSAKLECVRFSLDVAWDYLLANPENNVDVAFQNFGSPFEIHGLSDERNSVDASLSVTADITDRWQVYAEVAGQVWCRASYYDVLAGIKYSW